MERNGYRHKVDEFRIAMKSLQKKDSHKVKESHALVPEFKFHPIFGLQVINKKPVP